MWPGIQVMQISKGKLPWQGSSVGWSAVSMLQGCGFDHRSGHMGDSTSVRVNE